MQHRITDQVGPWIDAAIDEHGRGETIAWESGLSGDPGTGAALFTVFFWMPGAVLTESMQGSFRLHDALHVNEEQVKATVAEFLRQLREARSAEIAKQAPGAQNGAHSASGLILPGQGR